MSNDSRYESKNPSVHSFLYSYITKGSLGIITFYVFLYAVFLTFLYFLFLYFILKNNHWIVFMVYLVILASTLFFYGVYASLQINGHIQPVNIVLTTTAFLSLFFGGTFLLSWFDSAWKTPFSQWTGKLFYSYFDIDAVLAVLKKESTAPPSDIVPGAIDQSIEKSRMVYKMNHPTLTEDYMHMNPYQLHVYDQPWLSHIDLFLNTQYSGGLSLQNWVLAKDFAGQFLWYVIGLGVLFGGSYSYYFFWEKMRKSPPSPAITPTVNIDAEHTIVPTVSGDVSDAKEIEQSTILQLKKEMIHTMKMLNTSKKIMEQAKATYETDESASAQGIPVPYKKRLQNKRNLNAAILDVRLYTDELNDLIVQFNHHLSALSTLSSK